jgi:hypothetical protein
MPRRLPTLTMGSALATIAVLAPVGLAAHAILRGDARLASSHAHNRSAFKIRGNVVRPLRPGSMRRLNLKLTNRTNHGLLVTRITVQVKGAKLRLRYLGRATPRRASHLP